MIREEIHYRVICDRCGRASVDSEEREYAEQWPLSNGWTLEGGKHACDGCNQVEAQTACGQDTGHMWDTTGNKQLATLWTRERQGKPSYRLRYCYLCHRTERQNRGEDWIGYDSWGRWLGDTREAAR